MEAVCAALSEGRPFEASRDLRNSDRSIGAALSGELVRKNLDKAPTKAIVRFRGSAGQSFGAFLVGSLAFELEGEANDFVGKALSGGTISIRPPADRLFEAGNNVIAGNVCLFGATAGELFLNGRAGERFAVRNSGAVAVVEGVGDHACEYMTGGRVTILGRAGGNFGAGMSGGLAFVLDEDGGFAGRVAAGSVSAGPVEAPGDLALLRGDLERHAGATDSSKAADLLLEWPRHAVKFVAVRPIVSALRSTR
jgi:glutamate synthase domain-containing protein 3